MTGFDPFAAHAQMKLTRRAALHAALSGRARQDDDQDDEPRQSTSFDGGARMSPPSPPESHEEALTRLFATGEADVARRLSGRARVTKVAATTSARGTQPPSRPLVQRPRLQWLGSGR